jgi:hypothetical protein
MSKIKLLIATACGLIALFSCSKEIVSEADNESERMAQLRIITRAGDDVSQINDGRIYVFNSSGACVDILTTTEETHSASVLLPPGDYTVYAVASEDLSRFSLPSKDEASSKSEIVLGAGKEMEDFLTKSANVTLEENVPQQLNLSLERKVTCFQSITIKKVPSDVTDVTVSFGPLYKAICLDGTFPDKTESYSISLTGNGSGSWQATPRKMHFPSKGNPTVTISFTRGSATKSYSCVLNQELPANHHLILEGTYTETQGVTLTGVISGEEWGDDVTITFSFDETNSEGGEDPNNNNNNNTTYTAGGTYNNHYIVAMNGNTLTVLSNNQARNLVSTIGNFTNLEAKINNTLAEWAAEEGVSGTWRVPTDAEARIFLVDPNSFEPKYASNTCSYYCLDGNTLKGIILRKNNNETRTIDGYISEFTDATWLRPVTDITIE